MKINIPKISLKKLSQKETEILYNLKSECYGEKLAMKIAEKLMKPDNSDVFAHFNP